MAEPGGTFDLLSVLNQSDDSGRKPVMCSFDAGDLRSNSKPYRKARKAPRKTVLAWMSNETAVSLVNIACGKLRSSSGASA